jgi:hypothetical protein
MIRSRQHERTWTHPLCRPVLLLLLIFGAVGCDLPPSDGAGDPLDEPPVVAPAAALTPTPAAPPPFERCLNVCASTRLRCLRAAGAPHSEIDQPYPSAAAACAQTHAACAESCVTAAAP